MYMQPQNRRRANDILTCVFKWKELRALVAHDVATETTVMTSTRQYEALVAAWTHVDIAVCAPAHNRLLVGYKNKQ